MASLLVHTRFSNFAWITGACFCPPLLAISSSREWEQPGVIRRTEKAKMILSFVLNSGMWEMWRAGLILASHSLAAQQGQPWGIPHQGPHCPSVGMECVYTARPAPPPSGTGKEFKAQAQGQAGRGEHFWAPGTPAGGYHVDKVMLTATKGAGALPTLQGRARLCSLCWASSQQGQKDISLLYPGAFSSLCPLFSFR